MLMFYEYPVLSNSIEDDRQKQIIFDDNAMEDNLYYQLELLCQKSPACRNNERKQIVQDQLNEPEIERMLDKLDRLTKILK